MSTVSSNPLHAADPKRSAWVSANAGTGKTYTLANRVTRLLLDGAKPERILCLTYTKAAASEMASRLFAQLGEWAMLDDDVLSNRIAEIGAPVRDADGLRKARRLFALALETPGGLKILTIHAFCQHVLARFPLEAGVPPSFSVLDEQTARDLGRDARARVLERAGSGDKALAAAIAEIVTHGDETKLEAVLDSALGTDRRKFERFLDRHARDAGAISAAIRASHGLESGDSYEQIAETFCSRMRDEEARLREIVSWLRSGIKTDGEIADALDRAIESGSFDDFVRVFLTTSGSARVKLATKALIAENPTLFDYLQRVATHFLAAEQRCRSARAAALAEASIFLAAAVLREYASAKRTHGVLDYDDLILETRRLLETRDAAAWVLFKLDGGLDHILIDEGQDTSPEQWRIVQRLAEEFFAGSGAREEPSRTIFVVGDEKQSIFSFQGADPAQFDVQHAHFAQRAGAKPDNFVTVQLSTSRRSAPEILRYVDEVFADDAARSGVTSGNAAISHSAHRATAKGRVEFWPTVKPLEIPESDPWRPVDVPSPMSPAARLASSLAERIRAWTDGNTRLPGHEKPIAPGDIMVLMPRREPLASELIRQLKQRGVPVAGADRIRLKNQIAVMDLIALGRFALLPEDDLNLATVLRSPLVGISDDELLALSNPRQGNLWDELGKRRRETALFEFAHGILAECLGRADYSPPFEFYAHLLGARGMRQRLLSRLGAEADDALDEFLSLALAYEAVNAPSLERFLHWLERGDAEVKRDMDRGRNEVRVMTVHGAKGLEADIVVLPDTTAAPLAPGQRGVLLHTDDGVFFPLPSGRAPDVVEKAKQKIAEESLREHRRLLYVALTRPRDWLHICGFQGKKGVNDDSWYPLMERAARKIGIPETKNADTVYAVGEEDAEKTSLTDAGENRVELPEWIRRTPEEEPERPRLIRPSQAAGADEPAALSPIAGAARFERGLLIHALVAHLPEVPSDRRRAAAQDFLARRKIDPLGATALIEETMAVLDHPDFAAVFAPGGRAEVAIVAELPELGKDVRISGRLDRLAVESDTVLAVDFKTGRPAPPKADDVPRLYVTQMALYRAALSKIFPGRRIGCALVWTQTPCLMPLPQELLDAEIIGIRSRLDPPGAHS
ncbi:MAG TPA: double-strand break repair helicase AddA [Rhizomicrobium sp.]